MRWLATLVAVCGCNQVFDLRTTQLVDSSVRLDAAVDAPAVCPPVGTQLRVTGSLTQVVRQTCYGYTASVSTRIAVANCYDTTNQSYTYKPMEGRLDDTLGPIKVELASTDSTLDLPKITPEGDQVYFRTYTANGYAVTVYHRDPDGVLRSSGLLPIADAGTNFITAPTRGPNRHLIITSGSSFAEYADDGAGNWPLVGSTTFAQLGLSLASNPSFTADGLRLFFSGYLMGGSEYQIMYTERTDINGTFGMPHVVENMPGQIYDTYMPEDCSRLYFIALGSVFATELAN